MLKPINTKPLTIHELDGSRKIRRLVAWMREDEATFHREMMKKLAPLTVEPRRVYRG